MEAIKIKNLIKKYKNGVVALNDFNIYVKQGEVFSLLGPNGAGKSSLLNILSTYYTPTSGEVEILGKDVVADAKEIRQCIACVAQKISIDEHLSLFDNMKFQSRLYGISKNLAQERIKMLVDCFGLKEYLKYPVISYSGGIKRRLDIAMNMVSMPRILFLDEPTVGMDVESRKMLWDMIDKIKNMYGTTIFLTTHYLEEADQLSDTICIMKEGKEIVQDTPENLKLFIKQNLIKITFPNEIMCKKANDILIRKHSLYRKEKYFLYLKVGEKDFYEINKELLADGIDFSGLEIVTPSLEDVFLFMTDSRKEGISL